MIPAERARALLQPLAGEPLSHVAIGESPAKAGRFFLLMFAPVAVILAIAAALHIDGQSRVQVGIVTFAVLVSLLPCLVYMFRRPLFIVGTQPIA